MLYVLRGKRCICLREREREREREVAGWAEVEYQINCVKCKETRLACHKDRKVLY